MIKVIAFLLTVNLTSGTYAVPSLPDQVECDKLGKLALVGRKGAWYTCTAYNTLVVSQTGTLPTNYLTAE
jgi:hypothetical protein